MGDAGPLLVGTALAVIVCTGIAYAVFLNWRKRDRANRLPPQ